MKDQLSKNGTGKTAKALFVFLLVLAIAAPIKAGSMAVQALQVQTNSSSTWPPPSVNIPPYTGTLTNWVIINYKGQLLAVATNNGLGTLMSIPIGSGGGSGSYEPAGSVAAAIAEMMNFNQFTNAVTNGEPGVTLYSSTLIGSLTTTNGGGILNSNLTTLGPLNFTNGDSLTQGAANAIPAGYGDPIISVAAVLNAGGGGGFSGNGLGLTNLGVNGVAFAGGGEPLFSQYGAPVVTQMVTAVSTAIMNGNAQSVTPDSLLNKMNIAGTSIGGTSIAGIRLQGSAISAVNVYYVTNAAIAGYTNANGSAVIYSSLTGYSIVYTNGVLTGFLLQGQNYGGSYNSYISWSDNPSITTLTPPVSSWFGSLDGTGLQTINFNAESLGGLSPASFLTNDVCVIYTNNYFWYGGQMFGPFANQSLTISNAWNQFPFGGPYAAGGDVCYLMPGFHPVGAFPLVWPRASGSSTLTIEGPGETAAVLYNTNLVPTDTLDIATQPNKNATVFNMHDVCLATWTNAAGGNILKIGSNSTGGSNGGLAGGEIKNCLFCCWFGMTNNWPSFTPDVGPYAGPWGLIAINFQNQYGDTLKIHDNIIDFCAGVYLANDHGTFQGNVLESDGCGSGPNTLFATGSPFYVGLPVVIQSSGDPHQAWTIGENEFVSSGYNGCGYVISTGVPLEIKGDDYEPGYPPVAGAQIVATHGTKVTVNNAHVGTYGFGYFTEPFLDCDGVNFNLLTRDSAYCNYADFNSGLGQFLANMTNGANQFDGSFTGNGLGLSNLNTASFVTYVTNFNVVNIFTNLANQALPVNVIGASGSTPYTYCATFSYGKVYTNNLPVTTNVLVLNAGQWDLVPSNEISQIGGSAVFDFEPNGPDLNGGWQNTTGTGNNGTFFAQYPIVNSGIISAVGFSGSGGGLTNVPWGNLSSSPTNNFGGSNVIATAYFSSGPVPTITTNFTTLANAAVTNGVRWPSGVPNGNGYGGGTTTIAAITPNSTASDGYINLWDGSGTWAASTNLAFVVYPNPWPSNIPPVVTLTQCDVSNAAQQTTYIKCTASYTNGFLIGTTGSVPASGSQVSGSYHVDGL